MAASFPISRAEKRRRTELVDWAKQNGFSFLSSERTDAAKTLPVALRDLPFFGRGESPITECVLQRPEPSGRVLLFDYEFSKRAIPDPNWFFQRDRLPVRHTIVAFELSRPTLPAFELRPERFRDRVAAVFGANDFDFETHPEFSSAYHLDGTDPEAVRRVFHAEVLDWLETDPNWIIEGRGRWLLTCRPCDVPFLSLDANRSGRTGSDDGRPRSRRRAGSIHPVCTQRVLEHHRLPTASAKIPAPAGGLRLRLPRSL